MRHSRCRVSNRVSGTIVLSTEYGGSFTCASDEPEIRKSDRSHRLHVPGCADATRARRRLHAATPRIKRRNNEPLFTGYFFFPHSLSSRWTPIWKTTCRNLRCSRSASSAGSAPMLSRSLFLHSLLLFISISFSLSFSPPSPSSSTVSRLLSLEIEIAPSCAMRRFASELSIDWQTVDEIDKVRDTLPIGRLNPLRSCIVTCQSP